MYPLCNALAVLRVDLLMGPLVLSGLIAMLVLRLALKFPTVEIIPVAVLVPCATNAHGVHPKEHV